MQDTLSGKAIQYLVTDLKTLTSNQVQEHVLFGKLTKNRQTLVFTLETSRRRAQWTLWNRNRRHLEESVFLEQKQKIMNSICEIEREGVIWRRITLKPDQRGYQNAVQPYVCQVREISKKTIKKLNSVSFSFTHIHPIFPPRENFEKNVKKS